MITRSTYKQFKKRIAEKRQFIQCVAGPRQIGKTTMVTHLLEESGIPYHYVTAEAAKDDSWLSQLWESTRANKIALGAKEYILAIDEIQKIANWSDRVKKEWDDDTHNKVNIKLILLGSSQLLIQSGLTESLAGRFEVTQLTHWSFNEMNEAFGYTPEQYAWFGGYPGPAKLIKDEYRWKDYIQNSLVETTISKDILMLVRIDKPALLKQLFHLATSYSGQILSYTKMVGQLQEAGNTTTLSNYLGLLNSAGLCTGIEKIYEEEIRAKSSIPKLQVYNTALISSGKNQIFKEIQKDPIAWGRIIESCVGSHLLNTSIENKFKVYYWRHVNDEVDFVLKYKDELIGLEVKSSKAKRTKGMDAFRKKFHPKKVYLIDNEMLSWQDFIKMNPLQLF